ncbi:hypothetical protein AAG906_029527 [Vitis piasezkii]
MASLSSISSSLATLPSTPCSALGSARQPRSLSAIVRATPFGNSVGLRLVPKTKITNGGVKRSVQAPGCFKTTISCEAQPETLQAVQSTIAKQLSIEESRLTPESKFADLGADSLDIVEIMMALEEKFGVAIGEEGAQNIHTVQDAANLIEKMKADA